MSSLPDEGRLRAFARFQIIRPFLEEGVPLTQIAQDQGLVLRTARRWVDRYRREGLAGLARKERNDKDKRKLAAPLRQTKVGELCAELGITRQTLYRHVSPDGSLRPDGKKLLGSSKPATGKIRSESCD